MRIAIIMAAAIVCALGARATQAYEYTLSAVTRSDFPVIVSGYGYAVPSGPGGHMALDAWFPYHAASISIDQKAVVATGDGAVPARVASIARRGIGRAVVVVPTSASALQPGVFARADITVATHRDALTVPASAVLDDKGKMAVIVRRGSRYVTQAVMTGVEHEGRVEITQGLELGERVVMRGAYEILHRNMGEEFKVED